MPRRPPPRRCAVLLAAGLAAACAPGGESPPADAVRTDAVEVVDASGRRVALPGPAGRIVSLVPSATLALDAIGARAAVVGRTDFDTASWTAPLPSVGGGLRPSIEEIVALEPDLVVRFGGEQDAETPARLDALGIPHLAIRPESIDGVLESVRLLGEVVGRGEAAAALVRRLRDELDAVRASAPPGPRPSVAYLLGGTPPWVAGPGTYADELIRLAGGRNAFSDLDVLYGPVSPEELVARPIDLVLVQAGSGFDTTLVPEARVQVVSDAFELPGPAVADAARALAAHLRELPR